ncbi:MAG: CBS domain-containing protein [Chloroflexi bacterium]|nr:CBS domain-containing protein [Chloroflexota bacterium]MDA1147385.1 CBS domain-containing protein [Chloroflexota bacterium]
MTQLDPSALPTVGDIMSQPVHTVRSDENLEAARKALELFHVHHVLVENSGRIVGIVSDRDILRHLSPYADGKSSQSRDEATLHRPVYSIATYQLITVETSTTLAEATALMLEHRISCLPVVGRHGNVVGVVTKTNLLEATLSCLIGTRSDTDQLLAA